MRKENRLISQKFEDKIKIQLAHKLHYIVDTLFYSNTELGKKLGYNDGTMIGRYKNDENLQDNFPKVKQKMLEDYFNIPITIWETNAFYDKDKQVVLTEKINNEIKAYKIKIEDEKKDLHDLQNIINKLENENEELKEKLNNKNPITPTAQQNKKFLPLLEGIWYIYSLAVNEKEFHDGVVIKVTTIHSDYTIEDTEGGHGYLNIRSKESYIEKATRDIENLVLIRFFNEHITHDILVCSISSTIRQKTNEPLLNYAFMSRKKYSSPEAKRILNNKSELQLKIDLNFLDRIDQEVKSRY